MTAPLRSLDGGTYVLELFHGTHLCLQGYGAADHAPLLVASLKKMRRAEAGMHSCGRTTSGDTGKAALEGFRDVPGTKIMVFYPRDGVSDVQQLQMRTQTGSNIGVYAVSGNFDDAQTGVKTIFGDTAFAEELAGRGSFLSSANSINWGRLLPQVVYYVSAWCDLAGRAGTKADQAINFCVPTGNFGDILAGWYAKRMGLPIGRLICASNETRS
jgi:threonine synthase